MNIIFGNYGNNTIALLQWASEQKLKDVFVLNVDTGWSSHKWQERVKQGQQLARAYQFTVITLQPKCNFTDLIRDRQSFPSQKFQWCAGFLKGLPFLEWADQYDPHCEAKVLLGSRRADSRLRQSLPKMIEQNEHFGFRNVYYPLVNFSDEERNALIKKAGFEVLPHRSLECDPCIHSSIRELKNLESHAVKRVESLETEIKQFMFSDSIINLVKDKTPNHHSETLENFDMGCGSHFACGE